MKQQLWTIILTPPGLTQGSYGTLLVSKLEAAFPRCSFELVGREGDAWRHINIDAPDTRCVEAALSFCRGFAAAFGVP